MLVTSRGRAQQLVLQSQQRRGMATNPNDIKKRIKGTQAIKKITKSMQMVSAAKLKGDEQRLIRGITFGRGLLSLLPEKSYTSETEVPPEPTSKKSLIAVISTDKGLCGGINSFATKMTRQVHEALTKYSGAPSPILIFGGKSEGQLRRTHGNYLVAVVDECWKQPMNFATAGGLATELLNVTNKTGSEQISLVFNSFKSKIKYDTTVQRIPNLSALLSQNDEVPAPIDQYELEPDSTTDAVQNLYEYTVATTLYGACLDNATSEQSSRMQAMDNATKNAGEMIDKLLLQYNRARQSKITTELIEIISGAESLKG
jgi:F-type H+-transporting ATPase subunit gamma